MGRDVPPADPEARVAQVFREYDRPDSPGCAVGVIRDGRFVHLRGYGMANLEHAIPIGPRTVFDIGSTSKQFTAAAIALLAQDGRLSLDDDVRKHLPEIPDYGRPVTLRQMLHHTSGLRDYLGLMSLSGWRFDDVSTDEDALEVIARQKQLNFEPGSEWLYSNSGYFLLSLVVERASGKPLRAFARDRIFEPLGMTATHFHDDHTLIVPRRATGYSPREGGGFRIDMSNFEQTGDGSVFTTVQDLLRWDQNFYEPQVGGPALVEALTSEGRLRDGRPLHYALGLSVDTHRGLRWVSHGGSWAGYRAELMRFPDQRLSVACLCNLSTANPTRLATQVADLYLDDFLPGVAKDAPAAPSPKEAASGVAPSPEELRALAGAYRDPATGLVRRVSLREGKLVVDAFGGTYELRPLGSRRYRLVGAPAELEVDFEQEGMRRRMRESSPPRPPTLLEAVELVAPTPDELQAYAGRYYSEELDTTYTLAVQAGGLTLKGRRERPQPLTATVRDEFALGSMTLRFQRAEQGAVAGFLLGQGRIRNLRFVIEQGGALRRAPLNPPRARRSEFGSRAVIELGGAASHPPDPPRARRSEFGSRSPLLWH